VQASTPPSAASVDRPLLLAGIGMGVIGVVALSILTHLVGGGIGPVSGIGRPLLYAAIGALAVQGRNWARVVLALWSGGLALFNGIAAVNLVRTGHPGGAMLFLGLGLVFLASIVLLLRARRG
jgi:hypothetical protein